MICRVWRATATPDGALGYAQHFQSHVVPALGGIDGQGAMLWQSTANNVVDLIVVSMWAFEDAIRQFGGSDFQQAVVADDARRILRSFDEKVRHYSVVAHDRMKCLDQQPGAAPTPAQ